MNEKLFLLLIFPGGDLTKSWVLKKIKLFEILEFYTEFCFHTAVQQAKKTGINKALKLILLYKGNIKSYA